MDVVKADTCDFINMLPRRQLAVHQYTKVSHKVHIVSSRRMSSVTCLLDSAFMNQNPENFQNLTQKSTY
jgi:hypothetical protein